MNVLLDSTASQEGFDTDRVILGIIKIMAGVKCFLKLLKSHSCMAIRDTTRNDYVDISADACFMRALCPLFMGYRNSFSSLACGMVELLMSYCV